MWVIFFNTWKIHKIRVQKKERCKDDILFIGNQKQLNSDFIKLKNILDLPDYFSLPTDSIKMHKNPKGIDKNLNNNSIENLKLWYTKDYEFLDLVASLD